MPVADLPSNVEDQQLLLAELEHTRKTISDYMKSGDQLLTVSVTGTVAALAALTAFSDSRVILALPAFLLAPAAYVLRLNGLIQHLGGHRRALEEHVNSIRGRRLLVWEADVAPIQKRSLNALLSYVVLVLVWAAVLVVCSARLLQAFGAGWVTWLVAASYGSATVLLVVSFRSGQGVFQRAFDASSQALGQPITRLNNGPERRASRDTSRSLGSRDTGATPGV